MQKYYPKDRLDKNSLLYGNLKVVANEFFFKIDTNQSYDFSVSSEIAITVTLNRATRKNTSKSLSATSISGITLNDRKGFLRVLSTSSVSAINSLGVKKQTKALSLSSVSTSLSNSVKGLQLSISSNSVCDVLVNNTSNRNTSIIIYQLNGITFNSKSDRFSSISDLVQSSLSILGNKSSASKTIREFQSTNQLSEFNQTIRVKAYLINSSSELNSINRKTVRVKNVYNNKARRNS